MKKPGKWNKYTITCKDKMIWVMLLNGVMAGEMDMRKWASANTNPNGTKIPSWLSTPFAELPTHGKLGLQGKHVGAPVWFRNMKFKLLP